MIAKPTHREAIDAAMDAEAEEKSDDRQAE